MHLANTPVVSPGSKSPDWRGSRHNQIVASHHCYRGAALPSMNGLSNFLGRIQCTQPKIALKAKVTISNHPGASGLTDKPSL